MEQGRISVNQIDIIEVDADPSAFPGIAAPVGSIAVLQNSNNTAYGSWQKIGPGDRDWSKLNPNRKSGVVQIAQWSGTPQKFQVQFDLPFSSNNYVVHINGSSDVRSWSYESQNVNGFTINSNARALLTGLVSWTAHLIEETS